MFENNKKKILIALAIVILVSIAVMKLYNLKIKDETQAIEYLDQNIVNELELNALSWKKLTYEDFGYEQMDGQEQINIYDNGNAQIAIYKAKVPYVSYYDKDKEEWALSESSWWENGEPEIMYADDGIFLAKITGMANVIASHDGITWYNAGYCEGAYNAMTTAAYDVDNSSGIVSWWYEQTPLYYSFDSLEEKTAWTLVKPNEENAVSIFKYLTTHKGNFVGVVGGDKSIAVASSSTPDAWTTTIHEDEKDSRYMFIRSVNERLFVMKFNHRAKGDEHIYNVRLYAMSDDAAQLEETNLSWVGDLANNHIPNPRNIIWMDEWNKYALFSEKMLYLSDDGITWKGVEQPDLTVSQYDTFNGAIYIPGDGFYVKASGYVYYAPY
jgi:hypothetical protein